MGIQRHEEYGTTTIYLQLNQIYLLLFTFVLVLDLFAEILKIFIFKDDYYKLFHSLNNKQRDFFTHCLQWILSENKLLHVIGVACVGNSLVIKCLYQALLQHYCTCAGETPDD